MKNLFKQLGIITFEVIIGFTMTACPDTTPTITTTLHSNWPFFVGAAAPGSAFTPSNGQYPLLKHFNVLAAENDMKSESIMPVSKPATFPGTYRWTNADTLVNYAKANNTKIRGYVLIWHSQTPNYFFDVSGGITTMTKDALYDRMEKHIKTVFEKYKGDVDWWDVCNEVVGDNGQIRAAGNPASGGSWYTQIMENSGMNKYEFVLKAFQWARQYADANGGQNVKLYLSDYNIEYSGSKQTEFGNLIDYLISNNAPIDGVGFQTHIKWDWPDVTDISNAIDKFAAKQRNDGKKLMTQITELDISLFSYTGEDTAGLKTLTDSVRDTRLATQAAKYRALFDMFKEKYDAGKLDMVLVWGLNDGNSWLNNHPVSGRTDYPLLFDRQFQPKQAFNLLITGP
jgi:endo-1,4-beta-xylanase